MTFTIMFGTAQVDGRVPVTETHIDDLGVSHQVSYLSEPMDDRQSIATARQATLLEQLKQSEIEKVVIDLTAPVLGYATKAALLVRWRAEFRDATRVRAAQMAAWLLNHLEAGHWTDAQLRTLFGLSAADYLTLKQRLEAMRTKWNEMQAIRGE